ncbi:MAG TPA: hypothetical protein VMU50_09960 [Polyangia bacterium]|nr:hypothetical protein [Polyangia bacterium]
MLAWPSLAAAAPKRVGIPRFDGQQEALIRKVVMQIVKGKGFELVRSREIDDAAKAANISLDSNDGYASLAKELALSAIVTGEVGKKKARLAVRNGADGTVTGEGAFAGPSPKKLAVDVAKNFWKRLGAAIDRGKVPAGAKKPGKAAGPAAPEDNEEDKEAAAAASEKEETKAEEEKDKAEKKPEKAEKPEEKAAAQEEEKPKKKKRKDAEEEAGETAAAAGGPLRYLDLSAGARIFKRDLSYNQNVGHADGTGTLRPYNLSAPTLGLAAIFYPGAMGGGGGVLANIGLDASAELGFGLKSTTKSGASYPTTVHDYAIGLRYRIPFSTSGEFSISVTGGEHAFKLSNRNQDPANPLSDLPDTIYRYVRPGLFARVPIGPLSVFAGAAYRYILTPGQIKDNYFPNLKVGGIDAQGGLGYAVTRTIEVRAGIDVRRYFYDFKVTQSTAPYIVGGAIDQYITGTFMIAITLDGGKKD